MMAKSLFTRMCYVHVVIVLVILPLSVVIEFTCCVMCLRNFIGIKLLVCLLAFSVILVMFIFLAFLDTICKVMFVLLCMRKQKNGCVLLAAGSLWEAVLPILPIWYCYTILQKWNQMIIQHVLWWISTQELLMYSINNILVPLKWSNQVLYFL